MKFLDKLINLFFPQHHTCIICDAELYDDSKKQICEKCEKENLPFMSSKVCEKCGDEESTLASYCMLCMEHKRYFEKARAPLSYTGYGIKLIKDFKNNNKRYIADTLAHYMAICYKKNNFDADLIIPVPLTEKRKKSRGFNQAELLANKLSEILKIPVESKNLIKKHDTKNQKELNYKERQKNIADSMDLIVKNVYRDKNILLVDDVYTTGATTNQCAYILKKKGKAKKVYVLTACHTLLNKK